MLQTLFKIGDTLVVPLPESFVAENSLVEGSQVKVRLLGRCMSVSSKSGLQYKLSDLMQEMKQGVPLVEGWDDMPPLGQEGCP